MPDGRGEEFSHPIVQAVGRAHKSLQRGHTKKSVQDEPVVHAVRKADISATCQSCKLCKRPTKSPSTIARRVDSRFEMKLEKPLGSVPYATVDCSF